MTLYEYIKQEFPAEKRRAFIRLGLMPQRIERDLDIYADWLKLRPIERKMEIYAELAVRYNASESLVREAIKRLAQNV